jgi:prophage regulatory protein
MYSQALTLAGACAEQQPTGMPRKMRWLLMQVGEFPLPVAIGRRSIGWFEDEIDDWIARRPRCSYPKRE